MREIKSLAGRSRFQWLCGALLLLGLLMAGAVTAWADAPYSVTVEENNRLDVQITDGQGHSMAPGHPIGSISYVVKESPEGSKVSVYTDDDSALENAGKLTIGFSCDKVGTVQIDVLIRLQDMPHYYTDTLVIEVEPALYTPEMTAILSIGSRQIIVNDDVVQCDVAPEIRSERTFVPLRALSEIFDAQCEYDAASRQVTVTRGEQVIVMTVDETTYTLNGAARTLDAPAYIHSDRTMVPVRFIAEAFGSVVKVTYNESGAVADVMFQL